MKKHIRYISKLLIIPLIPLYALLHLVMQRISLPWLIKRR